MCFVLLTISINGVSPSSAALPTTACGFPGGATTYIKVFWIITQCKCQLSPEVPTCSCSGVEQSWVQISALLLSGCGVWVTLLSFLNFSVLICVLGRIEVPPQWVVMRTKGKNPDNALSTVPGTWLTLGFSLCSAIINKSRNMGIYLFPLSPSSYPPHNEIPAPLFGPLPCYSCLFFFLTALLEYNCFTMLC